jgi:hypothetical protein
MQEHSDDLTTQTTGRGYNRQATDRGRADSSVASDLYAPVPGDDDNTRPGMVGEQTHTATSTTTRVEPRTMTSRTSDAVTDRRQDWTSNRTPADTYTMRSRTQSESGMMDKVKSNPLAVVAAATAGGMLLGRMMRNRDRRHNDGYLRAARSGYGYQGYQSYQPSYGYQQPSFRPYPAPSDYRGYQGQGFQQGGNQGYQPAQGMYGAPQYRAEEDFNPEQNFEGRHENFRSGSHWD